MAVSILKIMALVMSKKDIMKKAVSFCVIASVVLLLPGCFWNTGKPALSSRTYVGPDRVLIMLLPPIGGKGFYYETYGFIEAVRERGFEADLTILDVSPVLYFKGTIVELIKTKLVESAKASGYKRILLVGTSLGGHGALLYITKCPEDVDGVVVIAPFLGGTHLAKVIEEAGGLNQWEDCPMFEWRYACAIWKLLKGYVSHPESRTKIILCYGLDDRFAERNRLLADALPAENVFTVSGGHDWETWKKLWVKVLDYFHTKCGKTDNDSCLIDIKRLPD